MIRKKIIIIDDEESVRVTMARLLEKAGYDTLLATDGRDAIDQLTNHPVDIILLDMNMPTMNGIEFLKYIRAKNITRAPVLMATGSSDPDQRVESYKLGVYDFIRKPEQLEVMLKRIENGIKIGEMIYFNEFIKVELMMAKKLQKYLYPEPSFESQEMDIRAWTKPLADVGGDMFDYIRFRDGRIIFFVADVSGHSISAALYTAIVKMVFRNAIKEMDTPGRVLTFMNRELAGNIPVESFVTLFIGLFNPSDMTLSYSNAGHPLPFLIKDGGFSELEGNDSFLGPIPDAEFNTHEISVAPQMHLLIYTDGVTDAMDNKDNPFGKKFIEKHLDGGISDMPGTFEKIAADLAADDTNQLDDCTLMLVSFHP